MRPIIIILLFLVIVSCNEKTETLIFKESMVDTLIYSETKYSKYSRVHLNFNDSSIFFNEKDSIIKKIDFYKSVYFNSYFPLKAQNANAYKLIKVKKWPNKDIYSWVCGEGYRAYEKERLIGKTLLTKGLLDINGVLIDSNYINNKHVFVKCWFIKCVPCVQEMPELNSIVEKMKDRNDIKFISLAYDKADSLKKFLNTTTFKYTVIPTYKIPEIDSLGITSFPTHLYVKNNQIQKVISKKEILEIINDITKQNQ